MSTPISCPKCGTAVVAPKVAAGESVTCVGCGTAVAVPQPPVAIPVAGESARSPRPTAIPVTDQPPRSARPKAIPVAGKPTRPPVAAPAGAPIGRGVSVWVWRGLEVAAFLAICVVFAFIGAAANPDEPGLGASRMARKIGAPLALLLIAGVELGLWLWKQQSTKRD